MADVKIANLTAKTTWADTDLIIVEDGADTKKMTVATLKSLLGASGGGIIDSGSNANGSYIKYADGTMICHNRIAYTDLVTTAISAGEFYYNQGCTPPNFPVAFYGIPSVNFTIENCTSFRDLNVSNAYGASATSPSNGNAVRMWFWGSGTVSLKLVYVAVGRWKA